MIERETSAGLYILRKLKNLSEEDKILADDIVKSLGEWSKVEEVATYLKKSPRIIYKRLADEEILGRYFGNDIMIYSKSLILILEKKKK